MFFTHAELTLLHLHFSSRIWPTLQVGKTAQDRDERGRTVESNQIYYGRLQNLRDFCAQTFPISRVPPSRQGNIGPWTGDRSLLVGKTSCAPHSEFPHPLLKLRTNSLKIGWKHLVSVREGVDIPVHCLPGYYPAWSRKHIQVRIIQRSGCIAGNRVEIQQWWVS